MWQGGRSTALVVALSLLITTQYANTARAAFIQQGGKMTAPVSAAARLGQSVSITGDGSTAIVGAPSDAGGDGSAWVFVRTGTVWDAGTKLPLPAGAAASWAGNSVAISTDGTTAVVGGPKASGGIGAAWIFTKDTSGAWQFNSSLAEPASGNQPQFGWSVGVSGDGQRIIVGGTGSDSYTPGGAWVFARSGSVWQPEGSLNDPTAAADASQGWSVAISEDGSTAIVGGIGDNGFVGAAWIYAFSGSTWSLQQKLGGFSAPDGMAGTSVALSSNGGMAIVGAPFEGAYGTARVYRRTSGAWDATGAPLITPDIPSGFTQGSQGSAVSLSRDGQMALVGEPTLDFYTNVGRGWLYTATSGTWPSSGEELVGSDGSTPPDAQGGQGWSAALSADGNTVILGAVYDNGGQGAFWIFTRDTSGWVTITAPCPEMYMLGKSYGFTATANYNPGTSAPTFTWSLSSGSVGKLSGPSTGNHVVVDMTAKNPKALLGPGPFMGSLCVDATIAGNVVHECTPLGIYKPTGTTGLMLGMLSLNCPTLGPIRTKPLGYVHPWDPMGRVRPFSLEDLARIESTVKQLAVDVRAAKAEASRTEGARRASR